MFEKSTEEKAKEYLKAREVRMTKKTGEKFQYCGYEAELIIQSYIDGAVENEK